MILIADDNEADAQLVVEAFRENGLDEEYIIVKDGEDCLRQLEAGARPRLIVLDLNMPKLGGLQVLQRVKSDPDLKCLPVVVLTTSDSDRDVLESYRLHANSYITKPLNLDCFVEAIGVMHRYWFRVSKLPDCLE